MKSNIAAREDPKRPYRQTARAAAAEETALRILAAFRARIGDQWFDEIRLEDVARDAGVTVQTVIRRFGSKEGLLDATTHQVSEEVMAVRTNPRGDVADAVRAVIEDYEATGDFVVRILMQEDRYAALRRVTDIGRREHRRWVAETFVDDLEGAPSDTARHRLDALVVATDVYVWKLVRRDMGRPVEELQSLMEQLVRAALTVS